MNRFVDPPPLLLSFIIGERKESREEADFSTFINLKASAGTGLEKWCLRKPPNSGRQHQKRRDVPGLILISGIFLLNRKLVSK